MAVYGPPGGEELYHLSAGEAAAIHKYISRKYSNGRWQYTYPNRKTVKKHPKPANLQRKMSSYESEADRRKRRVTNDYLEKSDIGISDTAIAKQYYNGIKTFDNLISSSPELITDKQIQVAKDALYILTGVDEHTSEKYGLGIDFDVIARVKKYVYSKQGR